MDKWLYKLNKSFITANKPVYKVKTEMKNEYTYEQIILMQE